MTERTTPEPTEWLNVMLGEIERKKAEAREADEEAARRETRSGETTANRPLLDRQTQG